MEGYLVTIEGIGGSGKTTLARTLASWLRRNEILTISTKEPGGTTVGNQLRQLLLSDQPQISPWTEALLFEADRAETYTRIIIPALSSGTVVLADRNVYGTVAYQGFGRGLNVDLIDRLTLTA